MLKKQSMNSLKLIVTLVLFTGLSAFTTNAQNIKTETFKVWGNCNTCKKNIENSLDVKGVKSANWDKATHLLTVVFKEKKISIDQIHKYIAKAGYDTEKEKADDKAYQALPDCCRYERRKL